MSTVEQIVDLIRAEHPKYVSRHAISTADAIALIEQYADAKASEATSRQAIQKAPSE